MGYTGKLIQITTVANELRIPMYLIIDEFDNFRKFNIELQFLVDENK